MTGAGLTAVDGRGDRAHGPDTRPPSDTCPSPIYWGKDITDERYLLVSRA